jgi:hypothetical protein
MIFLVERLGNFFWEVVWFYVWRGSMIFVCEEVVWFFSLSHSGCMIYFSGGCLIFFSGKIAWFFCGEVAWFLFVGQVAWFHLLRGCVSLCVERLCDFSHSLTQVECFIFLEGVWFFLRRGCVIFFSI